MSSHKMDPALLLGQWVQRKMTACRFAALLMKRTKIGVMEGGLDVGRINTALEKLGERGQVGMIFYPTVQCEEHLIEVLQRLCHNDRWRGKVLADMFSDRLAIRIDWLTAEGKWSNCLGTAPLLTMPVLRRSPYAALTLWPGPSRNADSTHVGITDIPTPYEDTAAHKEMLAATEDDVARLFGGETKPWRRITFCLDARHRVVVDTALGSE